MIDRAFFQRDPVTCARELIGCELVWKSCAGVIVETEAYAAVGDEACHTFARPSARAFIASQQPGAAYVYFNYGMYWLFNVLVKGGTEDGFVLIRALQPIRGIPLMRRRRFPQTGGSRLDGSGASGPRPNQSLCSGPGKLTIAMAIDGRDHGRDLCASPGAGFRRNGLVPERDWVSDIRVGISRATHLPWRFLAMDSPFISAKRGR